MTGAILIAKHFLSEAINPVLLLIIGTIIGILVYALCIRIFEPQLLKKVLDFVKSASSKKKQTAKKPI